MNEILDSTCLQITYQYSEDNIAWSEAIEDNGNFKAKCIFWMIPETLACVLWPLFGGRALFFPKIPVLCKKRHYILRIPSYNKFESKMHLLF